LQRKWRLRHAINHHSQLIENVVATIQQFSKKISLGRELLQTKNGCCPQNIPQRVQLGRRGDAADVRRMAPFRAVERGKLSHLEQDYALQDPCVDDALDCVLVGDRVAYEPGRWLDHLNRCAVLSFRELLRDRVAMTQGSKSADALGNVLAIGSNLLCGRSLSKAYLWSSDRSLSDEKRTFSHLYLYVSLFMVYCFVYENDLV
jgi:hypothetical protein